MGTCSYSGLLCCLGKEIVDILLFCGAPLCPVVVTSLEVITASLQVFRRSSRYTSGVVNCFVIKLRLHNFATLVFIVVSPRVRICVVCTLCLQTHPTVGGVFSCGCLRLSYPRVSDIDIYCGLSTCSHLIEANLVM